MSGSSVTITAHGVLDHARAETLAARIRAAVRNGKQEILLEFVRDTVIASPNILAFLLRAGDVLRSRGGRLVPVGDQDVLDQLKALGIKPDTASVPAAGGGDGP